MDTTEKIKDTIMNMLTEHNADDISVKMFAMESGISRQTLYNHYYNLLDAVEDAYRTDLEKGLRGRDTYHNWVEGFRALLMTIYARKDAYLHIYNSSRREDLIQIIGNHGKALVEKGITDCARDKGMVVSDKDRKFMTRFYMNVFMGIIKDFLEGRMTEDPEYIASRCDAMMRHHIRTTLDNIRSIEQGTFDRTGTD